MPKIRVHQPFYLSAGGKARLLKPGIHPLTDAEARHWYVKAAIGDGLAEEVAAPTAAEARKKAAEEAAAAEAAGKAAEEAAAEAEKAKKKGK